MSMRRVEMTTCTGPARALSQRLISSTRRVLLGRGAQVEVHGAGRGQRDPGTVDIDEAGGGDRLRR